MDTTATKQPSLTWIHLALLAAFAFHLAASVANRDGFTWMDPFQYYHAARDIAAGIDVRPSFPVASFYPWLLGAFLEFRDTIPFALTTHVLWLAVLAGGIWQLARLAGIPRLAPLALLAVMAAPAIYGLSRELYLEFPLVALASVHLAWWLQRPPLAAGAPSGAARYWLAFGLLMLIGFAIKMTYPLFLAGPMLAEALRAARARQGGRIAALALSTLVPIGLVVGYAHQFAPEFFEYYRSLGNTRIPSMRLIGPPELISASALLFYPDQLFRNFLFLLCPATLLLIWYARGSADQPEGVARRDLWLAMLLPLLVFTLLPVREPRHIAPLAAPLIILTLCGAMAIRGAATRRLVLTLVAAAAALQYGMVASGKRPAPYRLEQPMRANEVLQLLLAATPDAEQFRDAQGQPDARRWRYTRSILLSGLEPNEALALTWVLNPGVVMDLDAFNDPRRRPLGHAYATFHDLYLLSAFNIYNHRCGWPGFYETLTREQALATADALLAVVPAEGLPPDVPGFKPVTHLAWRPTHHLALYLPEKPPRISFRRAYAEQYLMHNPQASVPELNAVFRDLLMDATLRGKAASVMETRTLFPAGFEPGSNIAIIYFLPGYAQLIEQMNQRINAALSKAPTAEPAAATAPPAP